MTKHKDQMVRRILSITVLHSVLGRLHLQECFQVYKCIHGSCQETYRELNAFVSHVQTHESEAEYRCHLCPKTFRTLLDLGAHQYLHALYPTQETKKDVRCDHEECV